MTGQDLLAPVDAPLELIRLEQKALGAFIKDPQLCDEAAREGFASGVLIDPGHRRVLAGVALVSPTDLRAGGMTALGDAMSRAGLAEAGDAELLADLCIAGAEVNAEAARWAWRRLLELARQRAEAGTVTVGDEAHATDLGNAERFVARFGQDARYIAATSTWLHWDGVRWKPDRDGEVYRRGVEVVRGMYREAATAATPDERRARADHAKRSEAETRVRAMLELAKHLLPVAARPEVFDGPATDYLLNVQNGTLDLRTGELRGYRREERITRLAPVNFDLDARHEVWDRFLDRMVQDVDLRAFLQRAVGYTLTGDTSEQVLFYQHGREAGGKSTFAEAVRSMLGDYAVTADFESFLRKRGDAGVRADIARLAGARMVLSLEVDEGRALAEGLVKSLTGGDTIAARHLYQGFFEYRPAFKLWLVANTLPRASAMDGALWRRIKVVPFTVTLAESERDPEVKRTLAGDPAARSAILAWAVRGCLDWQRDRLRAPEAVRHATADYRADCDHVGAFLGDWPDHPHEVRVGELRARYVPWCAENGEKPLAGKALAEALEQHGLTQRRTNAARLWRWPGDTVTAGDASLGNSQYDSLRTRDLPELPSLPSPRHHPDPATDRTVSSIAPISPDGREVPL